MAHDSMKNSVMEEVRRIFKPEFLNRIDEIIVFHTLNKEEVKKIVQRLRDMSPLYEDFLKSQKNN